MSMYPISSVFSLNEQASFFFMEWKQSKQMYLLPIQLLQRGCSCHEAFLGYLSHTADPPVSGWCGVTGEYWWYQPQAGVGHAGSEMFVSLWIGAAAAIWGPRKSSLEVTCSVQQLWNSVGMGHFGKTADASLSSFVPWIINWKDTEFGNSALPELSL